MVMDDYDDEQACGVAAMACFGAGSPQGLISSAIFYIYFLEFMQYSSIFLADN